MLTSWLLTLKREDRISFAGHALLRDGHAENGEERRRARVHSKAWRRGQADVSQQTRQQRVAGGASRARGYAAHGQPSFGQKHEEERLRGTGLEAVACGAVPAAI